MEDNTITIRQLVEARDALAVQEKKAVYTGSRKNEHGDEGDFEKRFRNRACQRYRTGFGR